MKSRLEVDSRAGSSNKASSNNAVGVGAIKSNSSHSKTRAAAFGGEFNTGKGVNNSHAIASPAVVTSKYNKL